MPMKTRTADFTNVKDKGQFNPQALEPGMYAARIVAGEDGESNAGNDQTVFTFKVDGHSGTYPYYCGWDEKQMWKIRGLFEATGTEIPKKRLKINPNKLIGQPIGIELADDEYEGRIKSTIVAVFPVSEVGGEIVPETDDDDDDYEEAPPARSSKAKATTRRKAPEPEPEEEDYEEDEGDAPAEGYTEDQLAEMELADLLEVVAENGWTKPRKARGMDADAYADKVAEFILEQQESGDDEDDEPEPEPAPRSRRGAAAKKAAPAARSRRAAPEPEDDDEEEEPAPRTRRTAAKKAPAKKAAPARGRRSAAAAADEDDDLDDIDIDEV